jgi:ABC-type polysaccharide/polyol phosphate export permease
MVNMGFSFIAFLLVFVIMREQFQWTMLLIPIPIIFTLIFSLGVGMLLSSMNVFFRDLTYLYGVFTTLLFFFTPIMYHPSILSPRIFHIMHLNPLFHFVGYFRELALHGTIPGLWTNIFCLGFALVAFCSGLYMMMSQQDKYILYM